MQPTTEEGAATEAATGLRRYSADRPLLLLTSFPPSHGGGGAVNIRTVLDPRDWERIVWVTMAPMGRHDGPERVISLPDLPGGMKRSPLLDAIVRPRALADQVLGIARREKARAIWSILHGPTVGVMARLVRSEYPTHLMINDDPVGYALMGRKTIAAYPFVRAATRRAIRGATSLDAVSDGMEARYRRMYGREALRVNRGVPVPESPPEAAYDRSEGVLRAGVMGSTYGSRALHQLGEALARAASTLGVRGELLVIGGGKDGRKVAEAQGDRLSVVSTGHMSEAEALPRLRSCFLLYANYPFSWRFRIFRRTSFPIKLGSYAQVGRPLLLHTPRGSSIAGLGPDRYVTIWDSEDPDRGAALIAERWRDPAHSASFGVEAEALRAAYFDRETHRRTLLGALDALVPTLDAGPRP